MRKLIWSGLLLTCLGTGASAGDGPSKVRNVAIVVHEGVELLDFAGPAEVFSMAGDDAFRVYTVAPTAGPVKSHSEVTVNPEFTIEDCPRPDILVIPGGDTPVLTKDPRMMAWIKSAAGESEVTMTVCTGAFTLAENGLLDGLTATTHWSAIESLKRAAPKATVVADQRFVDNGHFITTAGVSAGIDGALHVVDRLLGHEKAWQAARGMQYPWEPPADFAGPERDAMRAWVFREWGPAADSYASIVRNHPEDMEAQRRLGMVLMDSGRGPEAVAVLTKAAALAPKDGAIAGTLGRAFLIVKNNKEAAAWYAKAIDLGTRDSTTLYNAACAEALIGNTKAALARLDEAVGAGFRNAYLLRTDTDLDSLRGEAAFAAIAKRVE